MARPLFRLLPDFEMLDLREMGVPPTGLAHKRRLPKARMLPVLRGFGINIVPQADGADSNIILIPASVEEGDLRDAEARAAAWEYWLNAEDSEQ